METTFPWLSFQRAQSLYAQTRELFSWLSKKIG